MIPANHKYFLLSDLAAARDYQLCVFAVYNDGVTALTGTRLVGCVSFSTETEYGRCHSIRDQVSLRLRPPQGAGLPPPTLRGSSSRSSWEEP